MDELFCCSSIEPFRPKHLLHEDKFTAFMKGTRLSSTSDQNPRNASSYSLSNATYVVQVVRQVNYGPIEWKKYFAAATEGGGSTSFHEVTENDLIDANFQKLNAYKNFRCEAHNKFFELNLYEKDPVNRHHWRANIARPAGDIDLPTQRPVPAVPGQSGSGEMQTMADKKGSIKIGPRAFGRLDENSDELHSGSFGYGNLPDSGRESSDSPKDFTACSAEDCGYCGHCDY